MEYRAPVSDYIQKSTFKKYIARDHYYYAGGLTSYGVQINSTGENVEYNMYIPIDALPSFDLSIVYQKSGADITQNVLLSYSYASLGENRLLNWQSGLLTNIPTATSDSILKYSIKSIITGIGAGDFLNFTVAYSSTVPVTDMYLLHLLLEYNI